MNESARTRVFAYGTLQPGGIYHDPYCSNFVFDCLESSIKGQLFDFPHLGYPGALEHSYHHIQGCTLIFDHPETEVLARLDELEGYAPDRPRQLNEYYRKKVSVYSRDGQIALHKAWCYFMTWPRIQKLNGVLIPSGNWKD